MRKIKEMWFTIEGRDIEPKAKKVSSNSM